MHSRFLIVTSLSLGIAVLAPVTADAACAVSVGQGEGPSQAIAERRAARDAKVRARASAGHISPSNASYSEPVCYVADDFKRGIATYGCEVQYSYCTTPALPAQKSSGSGNWKPVWKHSDGRQKGHSAKHGHWHPHKGGHGRIEFGAWGHSKTVVSCLRFNARASGRSVEEASSLANGALIQSIADNVGHGFRHGNVEAAGPSCSTTGSHKVTCKQTARYCF